MDNFALKVTVKCKRNTSNWILTGTKIHKDSNEP